MNNEALTLPTVYLIEDGHSCPDRIGIRGGEVTRVTLEVARDPSFLRRFGTKIKTVGGEYFRQPPEHTHRTVTFRIDPRFPRIEALINEILSHAEIGDVSFHLKDEVAIQRSFYHTSERLHHRPGETLRECAGRLSKELSKLFDQSPKKYYTTLELAQEELQRREDEDKARQNDRETHRARIEGLVAVFNSLGYNASRKGYDIALDEDAATQLLKDLPGK